MLLLTDLHAAVHPLSFQGLHLRPKPPLPIPIPPTMPFPRRRPRLRRCNRQHACMQCQQRQQWGCSCACPPMHWLHMLCTGRPHACECWKTRTNACTFGRHLELVLGRNLELVLSIAAVCLPACNCTVGHPVVGLVVAVGSAYMTSQCPHERRT